MQLTQTALDTRDDVAKAMSTFVYPHQQAHDLSLRAPMGIHIKQQEERRATLPTVDDLRAEWASMRAAKRGAQMSPVRSTTRRDFYSGGLSPESLSRGGAARTSFPNTLRPSSPPGMQSYEGTPLSPMTKTTYSVRQNMARVRRANVPGQRFCEAPSAARHTRTCALPLRTVRVTSTWDELAAVRKAQAARKTRAARSTRGGQLLSSPSATRGARLGDGSPIRATPGGDARSSRTAAP